LLVERASVRGADGSAPVDTLEALAATVAALAREAGGWPFNQMPPISTISTNAINPMACREGFWNADVEVRALEPDE
jgi:hypothetical protein